MQYADEGELKRGKRPGTQNRTHVLTTTYDLKHNSKGRHYCCVLRNHYHHHITVIKRKASRHRHRSWLAGSANAYGYSGPVVL